MGTAGLEWVSERTLGGKRVEFWWRADELGNVTIRRLVQKGRPRTGKGRFIRREELEALLAWMADREWVLLACVPERLRQGTAEDGIGRFLYERLSWPFSEVVFACHIAAILTAAEVWAWNGRRRDMAFRVVSADLARVRACFERRRAEARAKAAPTEPQEPAEASLEPLRLRPGGQEPPRFDLAVRFRALGRELRARFEACCGGSHPVEKGSRREAALRSFLRQQLPPPYGITRGEVVDATGQASRQVDLLIYDAFQALLLVDSEASALLAAESVYAAIEVKPVLGGSGLAAAVENLASVKLLSRRAVLRPPGRGLHEPRPEANPPIFAAIFSFESIEPRRVLRLLRDLEGETPSHLGVDCVCMLDRGIIFRYPGFYAPPGMKSTGPAAGRSRERVPLVCTKAGENSLLLFCVLLSQELNLTRLWPPDLIRYAQSGGWPEPEIL